MDGIQIQQSKISIVRSEQKIVVFASNPVAWTPTFVPFAFTATEGQTDFLLGYYAANILWVAIDGVTLDQQSGDFEFSDKTIRLDQGVPAGTQVFGVYIATTEPTTTDILLGEDGTPIFDQQGDPIYGATTIFNE